MLKYTTLAAAATTAFALLSQTHRQLARAASEPNSVGDIRKLDAQSEEEWYYSVGIQNYVFTLPLTILERERKLRLNPVA
jgi:hypothetical protein